MPTKAFYVKDERSNLLTTQLSSQYTKQVRLHLSSLLVSKHSSSVKQQTGVSIYRKKRTLAVRNLKYSYGSLLNIKPAQKTDRRIAELGADNETYKYTLEWLDQLRTVVAANQMWWCEPLVNLGIDSEIVFEWWHKNHKLTVYILGNTAEYIKVWGTDIDSEMEDGLATSPAELMELWKWLVS